MLKENYLQQLLKNIYENESVAVYDYAADIFATEIENFSKTKEWTDQLVRDKLAIYSDKESTELKITNFGKYWILQGGYDSFLKNGNRIKADKKKENQLSEFKKEKEELVEARLKLTKFRLVGFWLTIVISVIGLLLSGYNFYLIMYAKK